MILPSEILPHIGKTCSKHANIRVYIYVHLFINTYIQTCIRNTSREGIARHCYDATASGVPGSPRYGGFMVTQRRITFSTTPLDE
jgi:hypothetical protein